VTAVTLGFARQSRVTPELAAPLGIGTVAASTVLLPRVLVLSAILNPDVALALLPYLVPPFVAGAGLVAWWLWRSPLARHDGALPAPDGTSPLGVRSAITMALAFQVALTAIELVRSRFGSAGILTSAALLGLTDMDALTLAMNRLGRSAEMTALATVAIAVGIVANALLKLALALALGNPAYRRTAAIGLLALGGTSAAAIALLYR